MLVPTAEELERQLDGLLDGVSKEERQEWIDHPCTHGLVTMLEIVRLSCFEEFESGVSPEMGYKLAGQASIMSDLATFLKNDVMNRGAEDADPTDGT